VQGDAYPTPTCSSIEVLAAGFGAGVSSANARLSTSTLSLSESLCRRISWPYCLVVRAY
jgi:hypothetical protein